MLAAVAVSGLSSASAQSSAQPLQPLVETSARRLVLAEQVALSKWDSGAAVEDAPREAEVIAGAVKAGKSKGLDEAAVADFFRAQMEANKVVQYSLLASWRRAGQAPAHAPVDLVKTLRPQFDRLQAELITELAGTVTVRSSSSCPEQVAKAAGQYESAHPHPPGGPAFPVALDRALAATCVSRGR